MVVAPTNLESPIMMQTYLVQHTPNACNFKPLDDSVEIASLLLIIENLNVPTTRVVLGKFERHCGIKIKSVNQMVTGSKNDPTIGSRIHPKMGMGTGVKNINKPMKKLKSESFLLGFHHLQTPFIMLVRKLVLLTNIEVNTHHGLAIHSLFCTLYAKVCTVVVQIKIQESNRAIIKM
jgi:hypothetical protein